MNPSADQVRTERLRRQWSVRKAAAQSGGVLSNTWWAKFEDGKQPLTDGIREGVATAFGWESDWPERAASATQPDDAALRTQFDVALGALGAELAQLRDRADRTDARLAELASRIDDVDPRPARRASKPAR